jgi:hypothetical protein
MEMLNHSKARVISKVSSLAVPTQSSTESLRGWIKAVLITAGLAASVAAPV